MKDKLNVIKDFFIGNIKRKTITILCLNIVIIIIMLLAGVVQFETIDDYMIYELLSGKWISATEYVVYINIFLSRILLKLFNVLPNINWYVLLLLITHVVSFTIIGGLINKKHKNGMKIYLALLITMYIPFLIFLQYTSQAGLLIFAGALLAVNIIKDNNNKLKLILPLILIVFGTMIRFGAILYVLPYVGIMLIIYMLKNKMSKKQIISLVLFGVMTLSICVALKVVHTNIYNTHPIYKEYLEYNNVRTKIHDYLGDNYETNKEVYEKAGWSKNDYSLMKLFNNADDIVFGREKLEYIYQNVSIASPSFITMIINTMYAEFIPYLLLLICMIISSLKSKSSENIIYVILALIINLIFVLIDKVNIRTCTLNYVISILTIILNLDVLEVFDLKRGIVYLLLETGAVIIALAVVVSTIEVNNKMSLEESYREFINYANEKQENAYIYACRGLNERHIKQNILSTSEPTSNNICPIASWLIYSENYLEFKKKYNIEQMYEVLVTRPNVYIVVTNNIISYGVSEIDRIINYIKEHYNVNVYINEVESFNEKIFIYKLSK